MTDNPNIVPFDAASKWPAPDLTLLSPSSPAAPIMSDGDVDMVFGEWAGWLKTASAAKNAPLDFVAMALLTTAGAAIGNSRWVSPWAGWSEPPVLWAMCVGNPSSGKSPALDAVLDSVREVEREYAEAYKADREEWQAKDEIARIALAQWKVDAKRAIADGEDPPAKPDAADAGAAPVRDRIRIADATTEKVADLLSSTWRGLLLSRDELAGWLGGMDRYNGGGDRPFWLEAYGGRAYTIDRKSSPEPIVVDHLTVCVLGGTQPDKLDSLLVKSDDDGLLARFMTVFPDPVPLSRPTDAIDSQMLETALRKLRGLQPSIDEAGNKRPFLVHLTEDAANLFDDFRLQCRGWEADAEGLFRGHIGKFGGMVLRVSCVLAHLDWAADYTDEIVTAISEAHIARACHLVGEHLRLHAYRAYGASHPPTEIRNARKLAEIIHRESPRNITVREIQRRELGGLQTAKVIEAAFRVLEQADWLQRVTQKTEGRSRIFYAVNPNLWGAK